MTDHTYAGYTAEQIRSAAEAGLWSQFINVARPETVLALLDRIAELEQRAVAAEGWHLIETNRADEMLESARLDGEAIDRMTTNMTALVAKLAQLKVYVDTLQADAERYRWLRDRRGIVEYAAAFGGMNAMLPSGDRLDAAIDAAQAQPAE